MKRSTWAIGPLLIVREEDCYVRWRDLQGVRCESWYWGWWPNWGKGLIPWRKEK